MGENLYDYGWAWFRPSYIKLTLSDDLGLFDPFDYVLITKRIQGRHTIVI